MGRLSLAWLGTPGVVHAGQRVVFPTRKTLALLIYLSSSEGPQARERLSALLWPESAADQSRASLRRSLAFLREALGDARPSPDAGAPHVLAERDAVTFNLEADTELDLRRLQAASRAARRHPAATLAPPEVLAPAALLAEWQAAAQSVRGDFLEGFSLRDAPGFDEWAGQLREYWRRQAAALHEALSRLQSEAGQAAAAIETAARWLTLDPLDEAATARLMALHAAHHDRPAALQAYETYRARLATELRAEPAPETQALAERLRAGALPARRTGGPAPSRLVPSRPATPRPVAALDMPWVGRAAEFGQLVEAFHQARAGRMQVVIVQGEAGIGKTRLAAEFLAWAAAQGVNVLQGRAFETGGAVPYQLVVEALRGAPDALAGLGGRLTNTWLAELARLLPELREAYPDLALRPPEDAAQAQLFEAVARLGETLARQAPLILFADDVQWADTASLDLLHYAGRRWAEGAAPVLLLAGWRDEAALPTAARWLAGLERDLPVRRLPLAALSPNETLQLVEALGGTPAPRTGGAPPAREAPPADMAQPALASFGGWLFSETAGQPLFIVETLKALLDRGALVAEPGPGGAWHIDFGAADGSAALRGPLPAGVVEIIRSRLARLTSAALALLAAAAVLGRPASFDHLRQVAGMSDDESLTALEALLAGHLLREAAERDAYLFTHDKVRDVAYAEAGSARQRVYHRRALELLAGEGAPAAELAHHAWRGGQAEPAFRYSAAAGDEALALFAARDAIAHYEQALALFRSNPALAATADARPLYAQLGRAYDLAAELAKAQQAYGELLALARRLGDTRTERLALNRLATLAAQTGRDFAAATEYLQRALSLTGGEPDPGGIAEAEWNLAQMGFYTWDEARVLGHAQRALRLAEEAGGAELIARCHNVLGLAHWVLGQFKECAHHSRLAQQRYAELGNRIMEADSQCILAEAQFRLGQPAAAIDTARLAYVTARELRNPWGELGAACRLSLALKESGQLESALAIATDALAVSRTVAAPHWTLLLVCVRGSVYRDLQDLEHALADHREAQSLANGPVSPIFKAVPGPDLCADYATLGDWEQAYQWLPPPPSWHELTILQGAARPYTIETLLQHGEVERAAAEARAFEIQAGGNPRYRLACLRCRAVLAQHDGLTDAALASLREAVSIAEALGLPGEAWPALAALARLHTERGAADEARTAAARAAEIMQRLAGGISDERRRTAFLSAKP